MFKKSVNTRFSSLIVEWLETKIVQGGLSRETAGTLEGARRRDMISGEEPTRGERGGKSGNWRLMGDDNLFSCDTTPDFLLTRREDQSCLVGGPRPAGGGQQRMT